MWTFLSFPRMLAILGSAAIALIVLAGGGGGEAAAGAGQSTGTLPYLPIRLVSGGEYASRTSYSMNANYQIVSTTDHCLELVWNYTSAPQTNPYGSSSTGSTGTSGSTTGLAMAKPAGVNPIPTTSTGTTATGTTGTTGTTGAACSTYKTTKQVSYTYVYVDQSSSGAPYASLGTNPGTALNNNIGGSPVGEHLDGANQLLYLVNPGSSVAIEWHTTGPLTGGTFKFHSVQMNYTYGTNDNVNWYVCYSSQVDTPYTITVGKQICQVSSIDSRNAFSDADTVPTDANTSSRKLNFSTDIFHGGVFVGNMGATNSQGDRSGTARTQIYPGLSGSAMSSYALVIASMVHAGVPSYANGDLQVGVYCPSTTDPNLPGASGAPSVSTVNWTNRWNINPSPTYPTPPTPPDYTQNPVSTTTLLGSGSTNSGSAIGDYASFVLTQVYDQSYVNNGVTQYSTVAVTPSTAGQAICLASFNEASYITQNTTLFHWLVSPNYPTTGLTFPYTDAQPRLWLITGAGVN